MDVKYEDEGVKKDEIEDEYVKDENVAEEDVADKNVEGECIEDVDVADECVEDDDVTDEDIANEDIEYGCAEDDNVEAECIKEEIVNDAIVKDNNPKCKCFKEYVNGQVITEELLKADHGKDTVKENDSLEERLIEESTTEVDAKVKHFVKENAQFNIEDEFIIEENNFEDEAKEKFPKNIQDAAAVKGYNNKSVSDDSIDGKDEKEPPRCPSFQWVEFQDSRPFLVTTLPQETPNNFGCRRHPMTVFDLQDYFLEQKEVEVKKKRSFFRFLPFLSKSPTKSGNSISNDNEG